MAILELLQHSRIWRGREVLLRSRKDRRDVIGAVICNIYSWRVHWNISDCHSVGQIPRAPSFYSVVLELEICDSNRYRNSNDTIGWHNDVAYIDRRQT